MRIFKVSTLMIFKLPQIRLAGQHDTSECESNLDITTDADSYSKSDRETDNQDTLDQSSDDDVPNLGENPVQWTEHLQEINVPPFTHPSGPKLPSNWNPHSSPHEYFQLFFTDELLHNIVQFTNQYARLDSQKNIQLTPIM